MIDTDALLAWLRERATTNQALVGAVYQGLAERIERGQFNQEGGPEDGPHMVQS